MNTTITQALSTAEQKLLRLAHHLSPEHLVAVLDFAEFLATQKTNMLADEEFAESEEAIDEDETKWDTLLAHPEAQRLLSELADEALVDYRAGRTTNMTITDDGYLAPA